ncbi:MAG: alkaline phosphatase family protein [Candidatus Bathyarchaeia archaeon]|nr:alkaline phosphatase family protein [Candidatus Bathyarchaeota archaeon]
MIIKEIENLILTEKNEKGFVYPLYNSYCLIKIPEFTLSFFNIKSKNESLIYKILEEKLSNLSSINKIVLILLDGLGYNYFIKNYKNLNFFNAIVNKGVCLPLTTVFPSTTTSALATIDTGLTPQEHALLEWYMYLEEFGDIIVTMHFTPFNEECEDKLFEEGIKPKVLFNNETVYQKLKRKGVKSFSFINSSYASKAYAKLMRKGSEIHPFINFSDLIVNLKKLLEKEKGPAYFYVYWDALDAIEHRYGLNNEAQNLEFHVLNFILTSALRNIQKNIAEETLIIVTSDHGQITVNPKETIYLNKFRKLKESFRRNVKGKIVLPSGSPRDLYLHLKPNKINEVKDFLSYKLKNKAYIIDVETAVKQGLFGFSNKKPKKKFYERAGDLIILPLNNNTVWYKHVKGEKLRYTGLHGGLSKDEMVIPFAVAKLSQIQEKF